MIDVEFLTRSMVRRTAPDELAAIEIYLKAYRANPAMVRRIGQGGADDATGFGGLDSSITPYALAIASSVITFVATEAGEAIRAESSDRIRLWVKRIFNRSSPEGAAAVEMSIAASLTPEQLQLVRDAAYRKARSMRLSEATASNLADALVGSLALSTSDQIDEP
ncbi:hypothetical protein ACVMYR_09405 [Micromonospora sp. PTRAS2]